MATRGHGPPKFTPPIPCCAWLQLPNHVQIPPTGKHGLAFPFKQSSGVRSHTACTVHSRRQPKSKRCKEINKATGKNPTGDGKSPQINSPKGALGALEQTSSAEALEKGAAHCSVWGEAADAWPEGPSAEEQKGTGPAPKQ